MHWLRYAGFNWLSFNVFDRIWKHLGFYKLFFDPKQPHASHQSKARKSQDQDTPVGLNSASIEYAKEPKILEAPVLELMYYVDVVGAVPSGHHRMASGLDPLDIGNGDFPPEWGIDLIIRSGHIRYGPWADRQR